MNFITKLAYSALRIRLGAVFLMGATSGLAVDDLRIPLLQSGTEVYSNVTVYSQTKTDLYISHAQGLGNVKISTLDDASLRALGLKEEAPRSGVKFLGNSEAMAKVNAAIGTLNTKLLQETGLSDRLKQFQPTLTQKLWAGMAAILFLFVFTCCAKVVCLKAGSKPGGLVWLPFLQMIPLLRAAKMPGWFGLLLLVPGVNLGIFISWAIRIVRVCNQTRLLTALLIFPGTSLFAFVYLAFAKDNHAEAKADETKPVRLDGWASA